jgi:2',3'-cyclic-nucleotide 2'-phosphodiesterase (5'-nucleotidase family)
VNAGKRIVVYHTSDVHDRRGFGAKLAALVEDDALLVDCGDALAGSSTVYRKREGVVDEFAAAPYRAQAVGNREFHYLHGCMLARSRAMGVPWVCSNLIDLRGREPAFARELTVDVAGVSVHLLAVLVPQYRIGSTWERIFGWRFISPGEALAELMEKGRGRWDATLLLSHLGLTADRALATYFPRLSAIVGGHSHDTLAQPEVIEGVPIVHAGAYAQFVGRLELDVEGGRSRVASYRLVPLLSAEGRP